MPKVSIIIPVYNAEKYLDKCLNSVFKQTFEDYEVICVNDGSTDKSLDILTSYKRSHPNLILINQMNQGVSIARNHAMSYSKGEYIFFLDADDAIHPQCIEILYYFATTHNVSLVYTTHSNNFTSFHPDYKQIKYVKFSEPLFNCIRNNSFPIGFQVWGKLYKKSLLDGLTFIPNIHFEDFPFLYAVLSKQPVTVAINTNLYFYTIDPLSISHRKTNPQQIEDYLTGIKYIFNIYGAVNLERERLYLIDYFIPRILSHQFGRCRHSERQLKSQMYSVFRHELQWLNDRNYINWNKLSFIRRIQYYLILKGYLWHK